MAFKKYTNAELAELFEGVDDAQGSPLVALPPAQLEQGLEMAKEMMTSMKVTPAACGGANITGGLEQIQGASMAVATSKPSGTKAPVQTVSLISGLDEAKLAAIATKNKDQADKCKHIVIEIMGQKAEASVEQVPVATATPGSYAMKSTTTAGGAVTTQIQVMAVKGGVAISSGYASSGNVEADTKLAAQTLDDIAALIK